MAPDLSAMRARILKRINSRDRDTSPTKKPAVSTPPTKPPAPAAPAMEGISTLRSRTRSPVDINRATPKTVSAGKVLRKRPMTARPASVRTPKRLKRVPMSPSGRKIRSPTLAQFGIAPDSSSADMTLKLADGTSLKVHRCVMMRCATKIGLHKGNEIGMNGKPLAVRQFVDACYAFGKVPEGASPILMLKLAERFGYNQLAKDIFSGLVPKNDLFKGVKLLKDMQANGNEAVGKERQSELKALVIKRIMNKLDEAIAQKVLAKLMA